MWVKRLVSSKVYLQLIIAITLLALLTGCNSKAVKASRRLPDFMIKGVTVAPTDTKVAFIGTQKRFIFLKHRIWVLDFAASRKECPKIPI